MVKKHYGSFYPPWIGVTIKALAVAWINCSSISVDNFALSGYYYATYINFKAFSVEILVNISDST